MSDGEPQADPATEASPNPVDITSAEPKYGMTADPNAPDDPSMVELPPAPVDLTVEKANDNNLLSPTDSGVLLLWNEPADGEGITSYVVERKIGADGDWTAIGTIEWSTAQAHRERTSFSDQREYQGNDLSYRVGSRGSSAVGANRTEAVTYPTHQAMHEPGMPRTSWPRPVMLQPATGGKPWTALEWWQRCRLMP